MESDKEDTVYDRLPPLCQMVLEVLAARHRLGHNTWTFPQKQVTATMRRLEAAGLIGWKFGVMPGSILAWLTDEGRELVLLDDYTPPSQGGPP